MGHCRPTLDEYFMKIVEDVSSRTTCLRRAVGAILVKDGRILATGYNGAPTGVRHCSETGCLREELGIASGCNHELCRGLHAEQNAIIQAARYGVDITGSTLYVTCSPCIVCAKMLINAGIKELKCSKLYNDEIALGMLAEAGVKVTILFGGDVSDGGK